METSITTWPDVAAAVIFLAFWAFVIWVAMRNT
jgi:hypothetical protein